MRRILASSRYFIAFAVLGTFVAAIVLLVFGTLLAFDVALDGMFEEGLTEDTAKHLSVQFIEIIDIFLLATVLYIIALGLYSLFIDDDLPIPKWLQISTLDDLKEKLVSVVSVLLGVTFLGQVVDWDGSDDIVELGGAIALVIIALAIYAAVTNHIHLTSDAHHERKRADMVTNQPSQPASTDAPQAGDDPRDDA